MGRMQAPGKACPSLLCCVPMWLMLTLGAVKEQIYQLTKTSLVPSQSREILRDSHGVAQARLLMGNNILRILKSEGLAPDLPESLYHLIEKAVAVRKHLERNRRLRVPNSVRF